jgi:hypothetical protein
MSMKRSTKENFTSSMGMILVFVIFFGGHHFYQNRLVMACINSNHGSDTEGGKVILFGYIGFGKPGQKEGSQYRHMYIPLVLAQVKEENYKTI